ncbi:glycosyltransferase family 4 protein [Pseudaestuariivita rosea]|uniref:glycosyltransferase family 4 protein n=1 Tax=Pseudaestuariivita rosea TaxID=2763263 RepID=UPI001ABB935C
MTRIMMLGLRDVGGVQGGIETHVAALAPRLQKLGHDVMIIARTPYHRAQDQIPTVAIWCPKSARFETIVHSLFGVFYAAIKRPDILHIHAIGPGIVTPLARLLGLRVVVTHHGKDYDREKWGGFARFVLRTGEALAARWANHRIAISRALTYDMNKAYSKPFQFIPNGVAPTGPSDETDHLNQWGLEPNEYILSVGRLVPEKRHIDLIQATRQIRAAGKKLVIAGGADHDSSYAQKLHDLALQEDNVILTGFVRGAPLRQLFSHAALFCLPSSHEGLPIALLEAMQYQLPIVASDIPGNLELGLPARCYFKTSDLNALEHAIDNTLSEPAEKPDWAAHLQPYDWDQIAEQTAACYDQVLAGAVPKTLAARSSGT